MDTLWKIECEYRYQLLYRKYIIFLISFIFIIIPIFYQLISGQKFWENNSIILFFIMGFYGFVLLMGDLVFSLVRKVPGIATGYYKRHERGFNWMFIIVITISVVLIFYWIFGVGAVGPIIGGVAVLGIRWWIDNKIAKKPVK